jgi:ABC-type multidrug transport system fused ATPase/permease subunit
MIGMMITFARGLLDQHSKLRSKSYKAKTSQILKGYLFKSIKESSYITLDSMKPEHVTKTLAYLIDGISDFILLVPFIIASPITAILSFGYLVLLVGWGSVYFLMVFVFLTILISVLNTINSTNSAAFFGKNVGRAQMLHELCPNMTEVKCASYEEFYKRNFITARQVERESLRKIQILNTAIDFCLKMMPLVSMFVIIVWYNLSHGQNLDTAATYTLIALLSALASPMRVLSTAGRDYNIFKYCYRMTYKLLNETEKYSEKAYRNQRLEVGRLKFDNASFEINDGEQKRLIAVIMDAAEERLQPEGVIARYHEQAMDYLISKFGSPPQKKILYEGPQSTSVLNG